MPRAQQPLLPSPTVKSTNGNPPRPRPPAAVHAVAGQTAAAEGAVLQPAPEAGPGAAAAAPGPAVLSPEGNAA